jgi:hypothetical protein
VRVPDLADGGSPARRRGEIRSRLTHPGDAERTRGSAINRLRAAPPEAASDAVVQSAHAAVSTQVPGLSRPGPLGTHRGSAQRHELADARCTCASKRRSHRPVDGPESGGAAPRWHRCRAVRGIVKSSRRPPRPNPGRRNADGHGKSHSHSRRLPMPRLRRVSAREMKSFEALKGFGFSLEGDLQEATGIRRRPRRLTHKQRRSPAPVAVVCRDDARN